MVNTMAAIESGITEVQSALGGLGGCPFAPGASGNLSTEDMIWMLNEMGYETGIEFSKVLAAAQVSGKPYPGQLQRPSHPYRAGDPLQILMLSPMRGRCANAFPDHSPPF